MNAPLNMPARVVPFFQAIAETTSELDGWSKDRIDNLAYHLWARSLSNRALATHLKEEIIHLPFANLSEVTAVMVEISDRLMRNPQYNRRLKQIPVKGA